MSYKSKYSSDAWKQMIYAYDNKLLITGTSKEPLENFTPTALNSISNIIAKPLDKTPKKYNFDGNTHIFLHRIIINDDVIQILTHYPNKYFNVGDAFFDFGDVCSIIYNGNKVISIKNFTTEIAIIYIEDGVIKKKIFSYGISPNEYYVFTWRI